VGDNPVEVRVLSGALGSEGPAPRAGPSRFAVPSSVIDEQAIDLAGSRLAAAAPRSARVYRFGSGARAGTGPGSDLDFLVIETAVDDGAREAVRLRRVELTAGRRAGRGTCTRARY
jgi:hypothetical protein